MACKMESPAILGAITAGSTLSADLLRLSRTLRKMFESIKHAPREISKLADEINKFVGLFEAFLDTCSQIPTSGTHASFDPGCLITWVRSAICAVQELLRKVGAFTSNPKYEYSVVEKLTAHLRWYFEGSSVKCLRASLSVARESIHGFTNIRYIQKLDEQLKSLKQIVREGQRESLEDESGMTAVKRLEILQQKIQNLRVLRHEINRLLEKAKKKIIIHQEKSGDYDIVPETNELLSFTEFVQQYVESVLPSRSGWRTRKVDRVQHLNHERNKTHSTPSQFLGAPTLTVNRPTEAEQRPLARSIETFTGRKDLADTPKIITNHPSLSTETFIVSSSNSATSSRPSSSTSRCSSPSISFAPTSGSDKAIKPTFASHTANINESYSTSRTKKYVNDQAGTTLGPLRRKDSSSVRNWRLVVAKQEKKEQVQRILRLPRPFVGIHGQGLWVVDEWIPLDDPRLTESVLHAIAETLDGLDETDLISEKITPMAEDALKVEPICSKRDALASMVTREKDIDDNQADGSVPESDNETEADEADLAPAPIPFQPIPSYQDDCSAGGNERYKRNESL